MTTRALHSHFLRVPSLWTRVLARAIDAALVTVGLLGLGCWMGFGYSWLALGVLLTFGYLAGLPAALGVTLGKRMMKLRIVGPTGGSPTVRQALVREAFMLVGAVPYVGPLLSVICWTWLAMSIRSNRAGQGPHDLLAGGTRVIRVVAQGTKTPAFDEDNGSVRDGSLAELNVTPRNRAIR